MAAGLRIRQKEGQPEKKPTRYYSSKQEKQVAKAIGGKLTANSGATMFGGKGDLLTDQFLIECKTKTSKSESISIKKEWFTKNDQEKIFMGKKYSAVAFNFGPDENNYYIIDEYLFQTLKQLLEKYGEEIDL